MTHYDLIVCGAGPAGASAAAEAAGRGLRVALVEKAVLPRHKTCGGGVPVVAEEPLRALAPEAFVECDVRFFRTTWNFGDPWLGEMNPPGSDRELSIWMVQRAVFDHALVRLAAARGAEVRDGLAVRSVERIGDRVRISARPGRGDAGPEWTATTDHLIGADGANGVVSRAVELRADRALAVGIEVEVPHEWGTGHPELRPEVAHLEFGAVDHGYAWVFPKADHLNVGAGFFPTRPRAGRPDRLGDALKQVIHRYMDALEVRYRVDDLRYHAHPLPTWHRREPLATPDGRVLLAGDAAGLVNPFFGDGILNAVRSGTMAGACVAEGAATDYERRIHDRFGAGLRSAHTMARVFYRFPHTCYRHAVRSPGATRVAVRLLGGDLEFDRIAGRALRKLVGRGIRSALGLERSA